MTNSTRYLELDIAKGLAVLFMILVHTQDSFATPELKESLLGGLIDVMGGVPRCAGLHVLMGAGVAFSSATPVKLAKRGGILLLLALALNLLRGGIPYSLASWFFNDPTRLELGVEQTFFIDILCFAGLSMLLLAMLRRISAPLWVYALLAILTGLLNIWLLKTAT
ncbi:heparan-alpha-glucosaminide N-acetyltransferase domain-containing protein [Deefgea sp. CFH1-16]|uniref:heparan-alpha-glucosaminide N-acetyltransferase domain-containing protein n=1 Tax=Deefgea sp. CFH1-16 TaxID=2675457 RepID=UPI0019402D15|nr:heparan-alpha-glucosaminide N-acetyltransferase domain-containing protein [Deefgea sp. CFH1-16]